VKEVKAAFDRGDVRALVALLGSHDELVGASRGAGAGAANLESPRQRRRRVDRASFRLTVAARCAQDRSKQSV
jgi:hypothetical protein